MDFKGALYNSRRAARGDCLFKHFWFKHQDVFYSTSSGRLLRPGAAELSWTEAGTGHIPMPPVRRNRRSQGVNPSDPLRTESHPSPSVKDADQPDQDQTGAVSKETIDSCHDPLRVLQPNAPGSPIQDRARHPVSDGALSSLEKGAI